MNPLLTHLPALCNIVKRTALGAGEITLEYFDQITPDDIQHKKDGSPVSLADKNAEIYIQNTLQDVLPDIPFIGEEAYSDGRTADVSCAEHFWLVDPLDGTSAFIKGEEDFTVNIALIHNKKPVLGVVYVPISGMLYAGVEGGKATRWSEDTDKEREIRVRVPNSGGVTVISSQINAGNIKMENFLEDFKVKKMMKRSSSLKMCLIAEGKADIYPRLGKTSEWDTAAAHAILNAAGGMITDLKGAPLEYGGARTHFLNPEFVAAGFDWYT